MAKELFSIAAREQQEAKREIKHRKTMIVIAWVIAIVFIGRGIYFLRDFPLNIPLYESMLVHENQAILIRVVLHLLMGLSAFALSGFLLRSSLWSFAILFIPSSLMGGIIIYSDLAGFGTFRWTTVGAAYGLCIGLPILTIVLIINQRQKSRD